MGVALPPASQSVYLILRHSSLQKRDLKAILRKCVHVMVPVRSNKALLHDCESSSRDGHSQLRLGILTAYTKVSLHFLPYVIGSKDKMCMQSKQS